MSPAARITAGAGVGVSVIVGVAVGEGEGVEEAVGEGVRVRAGVAVGEGEAVKGGAACGRPLPVQPVIKMISIKGKMHAAARTGFCRGLFKYCELLLGASQQRLPGSFIGYQSFYRNRSICAF